MSQRSPIPETGALIRIHRADGSVKSFAQPDEAIARRIWQSIEPRGLFSKQRLIIAGRHSKSVFVCSEILRIDFLHHNWPCWEFPEGWSDIVELSEADFRKHARLDNPDSMPRREQRTPVGDLLVSFLTLNFARGKPLFLMAEFSVKLPVENQSFQRFLLSKTGFHMRLRGGGIGVVNLANLSDYTVYPGVAELPSDAWIAEPEPV